jgi:hypothetical protein
MLHRPGHRSPNAERQRKADERVRRAAERRERGVACYQVEIGAGVLDLLVLSDAAHRR